MCIYLVKHVTQHLPIYIQPIPVARVSGQGVVTRSGGLGEGHFIPCLSGLGIRNCRVGAGRRIGLTTLQMLQMRQAP
jgi:hypothetical protein